MGKLALLGAEAVALGAMDSGISAAYGYPGSPTTPIMQYVMQSARLHENDSLKARWSTNEKTALEEALGTSMCNRRALVIMKHVGLNVAADPFMSAALLDLGGGVVLAIGDDPGMSSSQNEQDSRYFADFAMIPCLEPASQQEAYDMTRFAFDISEELSVPVIVRLVTRLAHSRAAVQSSAALKPGEFSKSVRPEGWALIPAWARKRYAELISKQEKMCILSEQSLFNRLNLTDESCKFGVITTGSAYNYFMENTVELEFPCNHLHIGQYPWPPQMMDKLLSVSEEILVLEEGMPFVERYLRGMGNSSKTINGRLNHVVVRQGGLTPDNVRQALKLPANYTSGLDYPETPPRPPRMCDCCPHYDSYNFIREVIAKLPVSLVTSDIGCYAMAVLPPLQVPETVVCMGASISMAKGAVEAGHPNVIAVIGDSTFYHSGMTGLLDCVADQVPVTVVILDNSVIAMTGAQKTVAPSSRLPEVVKGIGVHPDHIHVVDAFTRDHQKNVGILEKELAYSGPSVIISVRECVISFTRRRKAAKKAAQSEK